MVNRQYKNSGFGASAVKGRLALFVVFALLAVGNPVTPAWASTAFGECDFAACYVRGDGATVVGVERSANTSSGGYVGPISGDTGAVSPRIERRRTPACPDYDPNSGLSPETRCLTQLPACQSLGKVGLMSWWWSRPLNPDGTAAGPWFRDGQSCDGLATQVVSAVDRGVLPVATVRHAFRQVTFALPQVHVQPEGDITLVNLPTYFEVRWPNQGVQPGEVASVDVLGRSVRVRPLAKSFLYRFGDGTHFGPTPDAGGVYPTGTVRHTYSRPTTATVNVTVTYSGEFSVDGGPWQQVGETITLTGPANGVQVLEARARLEAG